MRRQLKTFMSRSMVGESSITIKKLPPSRSMPSRHTRVASQQLSPRQCHAVATADITTPSASYQARLMSGKALDTALLKYSKHFIIKFTNYVADPRHR